MELTRRLALLEQQTRRDDRHARQAMLRLVLSDPSAVALAGELADLTISTDPLPREHPAVTDVSRRLPVYDLCRFA
jgi:hypothetical protein